MLHYVSVRTPFLFGLRYTLCFLRTPYFPVTFSRDFVDICFMFTFHYSLCFLRAHYVFLFTFSDSAVFPSTLSYCTSLRLLRSRTRLPLRRIRSLVYILRVLVLYYLRTNITYFSSRLYLRFLGTLGPSGSAPAVFVSSALELVSSGTRSVVDSR